MNLNYLVDRDPEDLKAAEMQLSQAEREIVDFLCKGQRDKLRELLVDILRIDRRAKMAAQQMANQLAKGAKNPISDMVANHEHGDMRHNVEILSGPAGKVLRMRSIKRKNPGMFKPKEIQSEDINLAPTGETLIELSKERRKSFKGKIVDSAKISALSSNLDIKAFYDIPALKDGLEKDLVRDINTMATPIELIEIFRDRLLEAAETNDVDLPDDLLSPF